MISDHTGWLFDVYPNESGLTLWLITQEGERLSFQQDFAATLYAAGPGHRLRQLWRFLTAQSTPLHLQRCQRHDIFQGLLTVLAIQVLHPTSLDRLFRSMSATFPDLDFYDADIAPALRHAAAHQVFPLARVQVQARHNQVIALTPLDTPWDLDPLAAPLRVLSLEPDTDPAHQPPRALIVTYAGHTTTLPLDKPIPLIVSLRADLRQYDPDILLTSWGDTWLFPLLAEACRTTGLSLPLNRDPLQPLVERKEHTYFSYGQIVHRGRQVQLRGRWHLDRHNATLWSDYGLPGVLEMARLTRQPVQEAARLSPGTGISSMQFVTALQNNILIPWHKSQAETPKTVLDLMHSDTGGMVYQPTIGLHPDVGGIDFVSMYPGIMVRFNISPEVPRAPNNPLTASGQRLEPAPGQPGIIPLTLAPLLKKRLDLKSALLTLPRYDCRRLQYQALASAEKWLLVTCFGYLGYKNARFGRIEAHEAVTAYGREALLRAKETAEDLGFQILHMYVDGLWISKPGLRTPADFQTLLATITAQTGLPISLDGIYRWVVFLPSRLNARIPVANRYFGVFQDGSVKVRGIEARRHDTAPYIARSQMEILQILAQAPTASALAHVYPDAQACVHRQLQALQRGRVPPEELLVSQKLSRELGEYSSPSPAARAVRQLQAAGRTVHPGERVRFLYTLGKPGVRAWDVPDQPDTRSIDLPHYRTLLQRAVQTVLDPIQNSLTCMKEKHGKQVYGDMLNTRIC